MNKSQIVAILQNCLAPDTTIRTGAEIDINNYINTSYEEFLLNFADIIFDNSLTSQVLSMAMIVLKNGFNNNYARWKQSTKDTKYKFQKILEEHLNDKFKPRLETIGCILGSIVQQDLEVAIPFYQKMMEGIRSNDYAVGILYTVSQSASQGLDVGYEFSEEETNMIHYILTYYLYNVCNDELLLSCITAIYFTIELLEKNIDKKFIQRIIEIVETNTNQNMDIVKKCYEILVLYSEVTSNIDAIEFITQFFVIMNEKYNNGIIELCDLFDILFERCKSNQRVYALVDIYFDSLIQILLTSIAYELDTNTYTPHKAACELLLKINHNSFQDKLVASYVINDFIITNIKHSNNYEKKAIGTVVFGCIINTKTNSNFILDVFASLVPLMLNDITCENALYAISRSCEEQMFMMEKYLEQIIVNCGTLLANDRGEASNVIWLFYSIFKYTNPESTTPVIKNVIDNYIIKIAVTLIDKFNSIQLNDSITRNAITSALYELIKYPISDAFLEKLLNFLYSELQIAISNTNKSELIYYEDKICSIIVLIAIALKHSQHIDCNLFISAMGSCLDISNSLVQGEVYSAISMLLNSNKIQIGNDINQIGEDITTKIIQYILKDILHNTEPYSVENGLMLLSDISIQPMAAQKMALLLSEIIPTLVQFIERKHNGLNVAKGNTILILGNLALVTGMAFERYISLCMTLYRYINESTLENENMILLTSNTLKMCNCLILGLNESEELRMNIPCIIQELKKTLISFQNIRNCDKEILDLINDIYSTYRSSELKDECIIKFLNNISQKNTEYSPHALALLKILNNI